MPLQMISMTSRMRCSMSPCPRAGMRLRGCWAMCSSTASRREPSGPLGSLDRTRAMIVSRALMSGAPSTAGGRSCPAARACHGTRSSPRRAEPSSGGPCQRPGWRGRGRPRRSPCDKASGASPSRPRGQGPSASRWAAGGARTLSRASAVAS